MVCCRVCRSRKHLNFIKHVIVEADFQKMKKQLDTNLLELYTNIKSESNTSTLKRRSFFILIIIELVLTNIKDRFGKYL